MKKPKKIKAWCLIYEDEMLIQPMNVGDSRYAENGYAVFPSKRAAKEFCKKYDRTFPKVVPVQILIEPR